MARTPEEIRESISKSLNSPIVEALNNEGITPSYLAKLLRKELKAKEKKVFAFQGKVVDILDVPALDVQQKARQDAHKLLDHYPSERHQVEGEIKIEIVDYSKKSEE